MELVSLNTYCELDKTSLKFKRDVSESEWTEVFKGLKTIEGCIQFWIGDCLAYREQKWGMYDDIVEGTGYNKRTLREYKQISESIKSGARAPDLSYTHHREVAPLTPEKQEEFLSKSIENGWTIKELRNEIRKDSFKSPPPMPSGKYQIIYADPPWRYEFSETNSRMVENQYPTMCIEELCEMELPEMDADCVLYMWSTAPKLYEAMKLVDAWGFEYKTNGIWDKENIGMGYWFRGRHEILLVATRGNFSPPLPEHRKSSVYKEKKTLHSKKPEHYYELIEAAYPDNKKIELFARNKRSGWGAWGNE